VLPEEYDVTTSSSLIRLAARFGAAVKNDHLAANVLRATKVEQEGWQNHNLVLLGIPTQNVLLRQFNDSLPWRFVRGSDTLARYISGDTEAELQLDENAAVGLIQIAQSPWNKERTVLALTGTTDKGAQLAVRTFFDPPRPLRGNLVVVEALSPTSSSPRLQMLDTRPTNPETPIAPGTGDPGDPSAVPAMSSSDKLLLAESWWK
jgi:hypothetical protein